MISLGYQGLSFAREAGTADASLSLARYRALFARWSRVAMGRQQLASVIKTLELKRKPAEPHQSIWPVVRALRGCL